jgi:hypothetical protein
MYNTDRHRIDRWSLLSAFKQEDFNSMIYVHEKYLQKLRRLISDACINFLDQAQESSDNWIMCAGKHQHRS